MSIMDKDLDKLAEYAKLKICDDEREDLKNDIDKKVKSFNIIKEVNTEDINEMVNVHNIQNIFRDDLVTNDKHEDNQELLLKNAPNKMNGFIVVPKMFE